MTPQPDTLLTNPFPGFRAYAPEEKDFLLGRSSAVDELLAKLRTTKFLAVVGGPCTGKSSLVSGGLLPALKQGLGAQAGTKWRVATMRPELSPIENLALSLAQRGTIKADSVEPDYAQNIETDLRESSNGIAHALQNASFPEDEHLLIVVDQFEDIFRLTKDSLMGKSDKSDVTAFVNLLIVASRQRDYPISVAITMRTLYLGNCSNFRGLPEAINQGQYLIPTLKQADFRQMMLSLADLGDIDIDSDELNNILSELQDTADQLPAFQYAIFQTVEYWRNQSPDTLDLADYHAVGGIHHAIHQRAEKIFESLSDRQKDICGWLFRTITEHSSESQDRKRPARIHAIAQIAEVSDSEVIEVVQAFSEFLTIINTGFEQHSSQHTYLAEPSAQSEEIFPHAIVDIQYESLITQWSRLKTWIEAEQQASETYLHLASASELYMLDRTGLYRNPELAIALRWRDAESPNTEWAKRYSGSFEQSMNYLQESHERYVLEEQQKEEEQVNKLKRNKRITLIFVGLGIISLILSVFAVIESNKAKKAKAVADVERMNAVRSDSVAQIKKKEAELATIQAINAKEVADTAKVRALEAKKTAEIEKERAIANERIAITAKNEAVRATEIANIAKREALKSDSITKVEKGISENLRVASVGDYLLSASTSLSATSIDELREKHVGSAQILAMLSYYLNKKMGGPEQKTKNYQALRQSLYGQPNAGLLSNENLGHADGIVAVSSYTENGKETFITCGFSNVAIWQPNSYDPVEKGYDISTPKTYKMPDNVKGAVFLPNRNSIIAGCSNGKIYEIINDKLQHTLVTTHTDPIISVKQMGDKVIVFSEQKVSFISGTAEKIDVQSISLSQKAQAIAFTPNLSHMVTGGKGYVSKFKLSSDLSIQDSVVKQVVGRQVTALDISPNQLYLAIGNYFGNVEVWGMNTFALATFHDNRTQGIILKGHQSPISSLKFNNHSNQLASGSFDKTARLWLFKKVDEEPVILTTDNWVKDVRFCKNDAYLLVVGTDKITHFFETDLASIAQKLCAKVKKEDFQKAYESYKPSLEKAAIKEAPEIDKCLGIE